MILLKNHCPAQIEFMNLCYYVGSIKIIIIMIFARTFLKNYFPIPAKCDSASISQKFNSWRNRYCTHTYNSIEPIFSQFGKMQSVCFTVMHNNCLPTESLYLIILWNVKMKRSTTLRPLININSTFFYFFDCRW